MKKLKINFWQTRLGFFVLLNLCFWLKYMFAVYFDFRLNLTDPYQQFIVWLTPLGSSIILLSIGLYIAKPIFSYIAMLLLDTLNTILLFANIIYYRQFSDFLTSKTIQNAGKVSQGLGKSTVALLHPSDIILWLDLIVIVILLIFKVIKIDSKRYGLKKSFAATSFGVFMLTLNMMLAETSRPRLLRNTFDRSYVVKYLGIDTYSIYDLLKSAQSNQVKKNANADTLNQVLTFTKQNYTAPSSQYFGKAKNKNVIIIHLESFQQFLIGLKVNGQEVTPFLNSLYHNKNTISFSNFYHQVGLGRTSDAENMLETGTFGISDGSLFSSLGSENTFQAAPQILRQNGYTSAVFHGNVGTFWNRNETYKNLGYNYFFDGSYFSQDQNDKSGYGLKDKLLFGESVKYLEHLQQPFYTKFITVTNHIPFDLDTQDKDTFKTSATNNQTVNNYFETAHYLDQAVKEFFTYLKKSGLYNNSLIMIYGDHYGLSNSESTALAPLLGKQPSQWSEYDNISEQRVPFMLHMSGLNGGINNEIGGEIDVLPTLLHLLGVNTQNYIQFGSDLLSKDHRQVVVFRNGTIVTPKYVIVNGKGIKGTIYDNQTGKKMTHFTKGQKQEINSLTKFGYQSLHNSDLLNSRNLLRFYTPTGFIPVDPSEFDYAENYQRMLALEQTLGASSTSLYSQHHNSSTTNLYTTNAPEKSKEKLTTVPNSVLNQITENSQKSTK
ncbi:LTA synthase family protein [Lactobacillus sp. PV012]|uniref:LTA synthase family protein n=1 Tax=Lactobacillus sp. PV012 TaxID=2594494 RepID=UPI00223FE31E|nr:LTA synthase family protein [Lactobacillus sp. PV012]QNQ82508.1 LTA synthase family protein [Lactobacillus sp. PV012]